MDNFSGYGNDFNTIPMLKNPFADSTASRVTASGFTETAIPMSENGYGTNFNNNENKKNQFYLSDEKNVPFPSMSRRDSVVSGITEKIQGLNIRSKGTVLPDDSVSRIVPNERFTQSLATTKTAECLYDNIIAGYGQNAEDKLDELDAIAQIQNITGLPQIFINSRLNFLIHLHKPLQRILSVDESYPSEDSLWKLTEFISKIKGKERSPHDDLLYQVVRTTIKNNRVRANPFNLPLLEVGMHLSDKLIYISFMQLYSEFQAEWFRSMKDMEAPRFHNQYSKFKPTKHERITQRHTQKRRKPSGSIISGFGL